MERILALFEFLLSDKGQEFCHYGIEGVDYRQDGSGYECLLDPGDESLTTVLIRKYPSDILFSGIATWGGGWEDFEENGINELRYGGACVRLARQSALWFRENTTQLERPYAFLVYPKEPSDQFSTSQAFENFVNCIIGSGDAAAMWEAYLEEMRAQGLEEYIDRQNRNYERGCRTSDLKIIGAAAPCGYFQTKHGNQGFLKWCFGHTFINPALLQSLPYFTILFLGTFL